MGAGPRRGPWFALAAAVIGSSTLLAGRVDALSRDYATVGPVVARRVDERTVVVIPVAGRLRARLSEPFRVSDRWRLYLTIEDARLSVTGSRARRAETGLAIAVSEVRNDVRIAIDVPVLGDYGARRSEEGMLMWIDPRPRARREPAESLSEATVISQEPAPVRPAEPAVVGRGGWGRIAAWAVVAAGLGAAVRYVRRHDLPALSWTGAAARRAGRPAGETARRGGPAAGTGPAVAGSTALIGPEPRGRSAEIDDAFRVEPENPAAGIGALAANRHGTDE